VTSSLTPKGPARWLIGIGTSPTRPKRTRPHTRPRQKWRPVRLWVPWFAQ
jgi:hypothetical protein